MNLLSIFHFVGAGLSCVGMLFLFGHYLFFRAFFMMPFKTAMSGTNGFPQPKGGVAPPIPPPFWFFELFQWFYVLFALFLIGFAVVNIISGLNLRARKNRQFSMVVAGLNCVHIPLGTILGIFTLMILSRPSVRDLYDDRNDHGSVE